MEKGKLVELMISLIDNTNDVNLFEYYDNIERGIKSKDKLFKLIIEKDSKGKYFICFNSIKAELTKNEFFELQNKWEIGKNNAIKQGLEASQQKDLVLLNKVYEKLETNS